MRAFSKVWVLSAIGMVVLAGTVPQGWAADAKVQAAAMAAMGDVSAYSHKEAYSDVIDEVYLGFNADGWAVVGVALREFKTYEKVTAMLVVRRTGDSFVIEKADIPDIALIKDKKKQAKVMDAVQGTMGRVAKDKDGRTIRVDAVSGATRYQKKIYTSFDFMAKSLVPLLEAAPNWERKPVPRAK